MIDEVVRRIGEPSAIMSAGACVLGLLARVTALMPKELDERLQLLCDTCFTRRAAQLRNLMAGYPSARTTELEEDARAGTEDYVQDYLRSADRHDNNYRLILGLLRMEQITGLLVGMGTVLGFVGALVAVLWVQAQSWILVFGAIVLTVEFIAVAVAHWIEYRYKGLRKDPEFQRS